MNSIMVIHPYKSNGIWVFDDEARGLIKEAFVAGADSIIDKVLELNDMNEDKFTLVFSSIPFPSCNLRLDWLAADNHGGNWYKSKTLDMEGWLCPALMKYFDAVPLSIYAEFREFKGES